MAVPANQTPRGTGLARVRPRPLVDALAAIGLAALVIGATEVGIILHQGGPYAWLAALYPVVALVYVAAGLMAWRRRPSSRLGFLIVMAGGAILLAGLVQIDAPVPSAIGAITQTLVFGVITHLLVAFPSGTLRGGYERAIGIGCYVVCLVLQPPAYLFAGTGPLAIADRPDLVDAGLHVQRAAGAIVVLAASALLAARVRRSRSSQRRVLVPLSLYGIFALLFIPVSSAVNDSLFGGNVELLGGVQLAVIAIVPVVFVVAASRGGFERTADIAELGAWLGAEEVGRPELHRALATTLGDPSLELYFRLPAEEGLVDGFGRPVATPEGPANGRGVVEVELAGSPVGAIAYDATLLDRPEEVREAAQVVALALDRERLLVDTRVSRARIAAAADDERRRIARDLHDGLQSRLVFLALQARADGDHAVLRSGIETAIDELRELVDGVMPAALTERGLAAAVEDLCDRLPMHVELDVDGLEARLDPAVETAAYFVVSEAIVNAVKHAGAGRLAVTLRREEDRLHLRVDDDGAGGARSGGGLRGMRDRVQALSGELAVESAAGGGTRIRAVIPCGS